MADCKYETWKRSVNETQQRRDILFCQCGACATARRIWHLRAEDFRPQVKERLDLLRKKDPPPPSVDEAADVN